MKKLTGMLLAVLIGCSFSLSAFAEDSANGVEVEINYDSLTQESQIVYQDKEILPNGDIAITTITASKPLNTRAASGEMDVTSIKSFVNAQSYTEYAWVSLTANLWFNEAQNITGWASASTDSWEDADFIQNINVGEPKGTAGTSLGKSWTKVASTYLVETHVSRPSKGTLWLKVTSSGNFTKGN